MRPSKRTRAAAIEALELAASNFYPDGAQRSPYDFCGQAGPVFDLVQEAWLQCIGGGRGAAAYLAEAACLLRDGWSPGEPVARSKSVRWIGGAG